MKQKAHAWVALRALKLIEDSGAAPALAELLCFYLSDIWEGAWLPDTLIRDMQYGHIFKMDSDPRMIGSEIAGENWLKVPYKDLRSKLKGRQLRLEFAKDEPELEKPYRSLPDRGGHLPDRVNALAHTLSDMLKMSDYPLAFYARKQPPAAYLQDLSAQSVKDLSISPNFSGRQIALTFFIMSHYICDAHMPLHCDLRDYGGEGDITRRLPPTLHPSLEEEWEKHFPDKEILMLHQNSKLSIDEVVKRLPAGSIIAVDTDPDYSLGNEIPHITHTEWDEMVLSCRVSYALARAWINEPFPDAKALMEKKGREEFAHVTNTIIHDTLASVAALCLKAWKKFAG